MTSSNSHLRRRGRQALAALLLAVGVSHYQVGNAQQVIDLSSEQSLELKRTIQERQERIRILSAQGQHNDVLTEAELLLADDPKNSTALLYRDMAERAISGAGSATQPGAQVGTRSLIPEIIEAPLPTVTPRPAAALDPPAPLEPRKRSAFSGSGGFPWKPIVIGLGVALGIGLIVLLIVWLLGRRNRGANAATAGRLNSGGYGLSGFGERPTMHGEATRQHTGMGQTGYTDVNDPPTLSDSPTRSGADPRTGLDPQTGMDPRTGLDPQTGLDPKTGFDPKTGLDPKTGFDPKTSSEPNTNYAPAPPARPVAPAAKAAPAPAKVVPPVVEIEKDSLSLDNLFMEAPKAPEVGSALGIDYTDTDSPFSRSQASDVYQTAGGAFAGTPEETIGAQAKVPPAATPNLKPKPPAAPTPTPKSKSDIVVQPDPPSSIQLDFSVSETIPAPPKAAPAPPPAKAAPAPAPKAPAAKPAPMSLDISVPLAPAAAAPAAPAGETDGTFNSLMFGGSAPAVPPPPPAQAAQTGSFNSVMFGGVPAAAPAPGGGTGPEDATFNSLMFGAEQTKAPAPPPAPAAEADLTFNSLMFGAEQTKAPAAAPAPAAPAAEADLTFNSLMFGAEQTKAPGLAPPPAPASAPVSAPAAAAESGESTKMIIPPAAAAAAGSAAAGKGTMFDRQRDAGKKAMEEKDYARAVQCFSVAASLKPTDKEIRELLEEARKLRRG